MASSLCSPEYTRVSRSFCFPAVATAVACAASTLRSTRRSVSSSYYEAMGRNAYDHVHGLMRMQGGAIQRNPFAQIFAELSNKFSGVVRAFKKLGGRTAPDDELRELVERFERGEVVDFAPLFTKK